MSLPPALQPLADYPQFFLWRIENGRKVPVDPSTGFVHNAHDPAIWYPYEAADAMRALWSDCGVAFAISKEAGFWFLDIDHCLQADGTWSPLAQQICAQLTGAAIEVSQSGKGLHLFGRGTLPPHGCKNAALGLELYDDKRFVALTGAGTTGNAATDHTGALTSIIAQHFPTSNGTGSTDGRESWADVADADWHGPADDIELINRMLTARSSIGVVLNGKASFTDLWTCNAAVLADTYPDPDPSRQWDYSQADSALAQHLAFWTGKNTERMRRIMWLSALKREKWEKHKTYLWRTISHACGKQEKVFKARNGHSKIPPAPTGAIIGDSTGPLWMTSEGQVEHFKGCIYIRDIHKMFVPDGALLKPDQFRATYGGYNFSMDYGNEKTSRSAWEVFTESQSVKFPKVESSCFRPELISGAMVTEEGRRMVNTYVPIQTDRKKGSAQPFLRHVELMLPNETDRAILLAYMAAIVQHPGVKFQWCPILQGTEGNGKTLLIAVLSHAVGHRYTHLPNAKDLGGNGSIFTGWIQNKLLIGIEEITFTDRADIFEALKPIITNARLEIQKKGEDQITGDNRANFIMFCNLKESVAVGIDKRRYCVFYTAQQCMDDLKRDGMDGPYFPRLYSWLRNEGYSIVNEYLHNYQIPDELNPATTLMRAPPTSSTPEMLNISKTAIEQEIMEAIGEGRRGFANGWISSTALEVLLRDLGRARQLAHNKRRTVLQGLGYDWHPGLVDGRTSSILPGETGRTRLFIRYGHIAAHLIHSTAIVDAYLRDQGQFGAILPKGASVTPIKTPV